MHPRRNVLPYCAFAGSTSLSLWSFLCSKSSFSGFSPSSSRLPHSGPYKRQQQTSQRSDEVVDQHTYSLKFSLGLFGVSATLYAPSALGVMVLIGGQPAAPATRPLRAFMTQASDIPRSSDRGTSLGVQSHHREDLDVCLVGLHPCIEDCR